MGIKETNARAAAFIDTLAAEFQRVFGVESKIRKLADRDNHTLMVETYRYILPLGSIEANVGSMRFGLYTFNKGLDEFETAFGFDSELFGTPRLSEREATVDRIIAYIREKIHVPR